MLTRYDAAPLDLIKKDAQTGFIHIANVPIARVGVFPYLKADNSVEMEAKLPTELLTQSTVKSAENKPVTDDHPAELVTQQNAAKYMKGFTASNAHVDHDTLRVDLTITDHDLINEINQGKQELSIGFQTDVVPVKGEFRGISYDSIQKNIQINHVAVVRRGRAGHNVRLIGDSAEMVEEHTKQRGEKMETTRVRLDGQNITVATADAAKIIKLDDDLSDKAKKIAALKKQIKDLEEQLAELEGKAKLNEASATKAQAKADALEKQLTKSYQYENDHLDEAVESRLSLINQIKPYLGDDYSFKGKSSKELKLAAIRQVDDTAELSNKSDEYIDAYFTAMDHNHQQAKVVGYRGPVLKTDSGSQSASELLKARYNLAKQVKGDK